MFTISILKNRTALVVATLAVIVASPVSRAQTVPERTQVIVPFGFEVGSAHFAPGRYVLSTEGENVILVQGGKHSALTMSSHETSLDPAVSSKVIFDQYGNHYFLREIWRKGKTNHVRCVESKPEQGIRRELQSEHRASVETHTSVEVAAMELPR